MKVVSTLTDVVQAKLDAVVADAGKRAANIISRETRAAGEDSEDGHPSSTSMHRMMTMPEPMTHGMVLEALKSEIALANITFLLEDDPSFKAFSNDERFRRTVASLITQNCVQLLGTHINCYSVERNMRARLPEFNIHKYYTFDGTCNNKVYKTFGATPMPLKRLLPAEYDPPPSTPRQRGRCGEPLPNPRALSNSLSFGNQIQGSRFTLLGIFFGLLVDHDIARTCSGNFNHGQSCSTMCHSTKGSACLPIPVGRDEKELSCRAGQCIPFTRSCPACIQSSGHGHHGYVKAREQINQITSYIDGGPVYGGPDPNAPNYWKTLVDLSTGKMRVHKSSFNTDLFPNATVNFNSCDGGCFVAGDRRVNVVTGVTAMYQIFFREHNRLVDELKSVNPRWSPNKLYLEVRKINAAQIQHITYNEFVPLLLGRSLGHYFYHPRFDVSTSNAFTTASYRFAHSALTEKYKLVNSLYQEVEPLQMFDSFFDTNHFRKPGLLDNLLRGMSVQPAFKVDNKFSDSIRNRLFETRNKGCGMDLFSINIQRGRDHGLPPYNKWREFAQRHCGVTTGRVNSFDDLRYEMPQERINALKSVYQHVDDIDLYAGGVAENLHYNAPTGPTFWCINKVQFLHFRHGDSLFYTNRHVFTPYQLREIQKITLAKIICRNGDMIDKIPPQVMKIVPNNPLAHCSSLPGVDITKWRDYYYYPYSYRG